MPDQDNGGEPQASAEEKGVDSPSASGTKFSDGSTFNDGTTFNAGDPAQPPPPDHDVIAQAMERRRSPAAVERQRVRDEQRQAALAARRKQEDEARAALKKQQRAALAASRRRASVRAGPVGRVVSATGTASGGASAQGVGESVVASGPLPTIHMTAPTCTASGNQTAQIAASTPMGMPLTLRTAAEADSENSGDLLTDGDGNLIEDGEGNAINTGPGPKTTTISRDFSSPVETLAKVGQDVTIQLTGVEAKGEVGEIKGEANITLGEVALEARGQGGNTGSANITLGPVTVEATGAVSDPPTPPADPQEPSAAPSGGYGRGGFGQGPYGGSPPPPPPAESAAAEEPRREPMHIHEDVSEMLTPRDSFEVVVVSPPTVPPPRSAAILPEWVDGVLKVPAKPAAGDLPEEQITALFSLLRRDLAAFAERLSGSNADRDFVDYVRRLAASIPEGPPDQPTVFEVGHASDLFESYGDTFAEETSSNFLIRQYRALATRLQEAAAQFWVWKDLKRNAREHPLTSAQIQATPALVKQLIDQLDGPEARAIVDESVRAALRNFLPAEPDLPAVSPARAADAVASQENILQKIGEAGLLAVSAVGGKIGEGALEGVKQVSKEAVVWSFRFFVYNLAVSNFAATFPDAQVWIDAVKAFFKAHKTA